MEDSPIGIKSPGFDETYKTPATSLDEGAPDAICIKINLSDEKLPPLPLPSSRLPLVPPMQRKCLVFAVLFCGSITILLMIGLGLTVKFLIVDEKSHQHEDTCEIVSCSPVGMVFALSLNGYTYRQFILSPANCPDQNVTACSYDDRDLPDSLSLDAPGAPKLGSILITGLGIFLIMTVAITWKYYWKCGKTMYSSSALAQDLSPSLEQSSIERDGSS